MLANSKDIHYMAVIDNIMPTGNQLIMSVSIIDCSVTFEKDI